MFTIKRLFHLWVFIGTLLIWMTGGVTAVAARDLQGTRSLSMGGALRAAPSGETAVLLNPAGMRLYKNYLINALYQYRGSDSGSLLNFSVVDSATKRIAAGIYYSFIHAEPKRTLAGKAGNPPFALEETLTTHEAGLALAYPFGDVFFLGVTTKYIHLDVDQPDNTPAEAQDDGTSGWTLDVGGILKPMSQLNLAVTGHNLIKMDHSEYPRMLGMGIAYALDTTLLAEFNTVLDFDTADKVKASYHAGGELFFLKYYSLRGGFQYDSVREATYVTTGLGVVIRKVAIDFGLRQMVNGGAETLVAFSLRYFVQY